MVILFVVVSCEKESAEFENQETLSAVKSVGAVNGDCSSTKYNSLWVLDGTGQIGNRSDGATSCMEYSGYVTSNKIVNYDRLVEVYYFYEDKNPAKRERNGLIDAEIFRIPAYSNKSTTRPILRTSTQELNGKIKTGIAIVKRTNGTVENCYEGSKLEFSFVNCWVDGAKLPKIKPPKLPKN